jgi:hypothetical protein
MQNNTYIEITNSEAFLEIGLPFILVITIILILFECTTPNYYNLY